MQIKGSWPPKILKIFYRANNYLAKIPHLGFACHPVFNNKIGSHVERGRIYPDGIPQVELIGRHRIFINIFIGAAPARPADSLSGAWVSTQSMQASVMLCS